MTIRTTSIATGLAIVAAAASMAAYSAPAAKSAPKAAVKAVKAPANAAASVNGVVITKSELAKFNSDWHIGQTLDELIRFRIVDQAAKKANISVTDKELKDGLARIKKSIAQQVPPGMSVAAYMASNGLSDGYLNQVVKFQLQVTKFVARDINYSSYVRASHILIKPVEVVKAEVTAELTEDAAAKKYQDDLQKASVDAEAKAKTLMDAIKAGRSFEEAAQAEGTDATKDRGGDLWWFAKGKMIPEFEAACFAPGLKVGDLIGPVKTSFGWHLIKITGLGNKMTQAEQYQIAQEQPQQVFQKILQQLEKNAKVTNYLYPSK